MTTPAPKRKSDSFLELVKDTDSPEVRAHKIAALVCVQAILMASIASRETERAIGKAASSSKCSLPRAK